ncbi:UvrD-helicase domain-containing protein [Acrocarpospora sp. B8E8]|uniref:UvrD-helicase domain-containing protein n=1 Tax=Acrocarpospora sp. B8E8 TaxID=3153572 RepID=UPI00325D5C49
MTTPTYEQDLATDAFRSEGNVVLQAGAGTGKTTTLTMLAAATRRSGLYLAFNKSIARAARRVFPAHVACRTTHSLAYAAVGRYFDDRIKEAVRIPSWRTGEKLGISRNMVVTIGERRVTNKAISSAALRTVNQFCYSADEEIGPHHVPRLRGLEQPFLHAQLVDLVLPYARKAWQDLQHPREGVVRFSHDHYLKIWALTEPRIDVDFLLLDEAQDTNPAFEKVFTAQAGRSQLVMVGDSAQAIYGWRGARDVMTDFDGIQLRLSQSFRFGPALAEEANRWLAIVGAPIRLHGTPAIPTELTTVERPDAILCRSNVGAMTEVMNLLNENKRVALAGGGQELVKLAEAARDLKAGRRTSHPELILFPTWADLQEYAEYDIAGRDLMPLIDLVDEYGTDIILDALSRLHDEHQAEVVVSTTHRAKGREWPAVRVGDDFADTEPEDEQDDGGRRYSGTIGPAEARVAYVAVTRARHRLDLGGLAWINRRPAPAPDPINRHPRDGDL